MDFGRLKQAGLEARHWLELSNPQLPETAVLKKLGLLLCAGIEGDSGLSCNQPSSWRDFELTRLVIMSREELQSFLGEISLWPPEACSQAGPRHAECLSCLAISYAQSGDISTVAALLRSAAHLGLQHPMLEIAAEYLLDQQQPDGSFGLISEELISVETEEKRQEAVLRITVEVLWALAEINAQLLTCS